MFYKSWKRVVALCIIYYINTSILFVGHLKIYNNRIDSELNFEMNVLI